MGAIENYFLKKYADKRRFDRDQLFVGILASTKQEYCGNDRFKTMYRPNRFVIVQETSEEEMNEFIKKEFGSRPGIIYEHITYPQWSKVPYNLSTSNATYYKSPTMSNMVFPLSDYNIPYTKLESEKLIPHLEMLYGKVIPLSKIFNSKIELSSKLSLNELVELEQYLNNYTNVYEVAKGIENSQ